MNLEEGYHILGTPRGADMDAIKTAYRKMAFALHPDLNPKDPNAKRKFQRLNEAYLLLKHYHENKSQKFEKPKPPPGKKPPPKEEPGAAERARAEAAYKKQQKKKASYAKASSAESTSGFYFRREEVLQDLLKDPFARQVFQDIYRQVKDANPTGTVRSPRKKELNLQWGESKVSLDLSKGMMGGIKEYFRKQLDDEQTVHLPHTSLLPGARIRVGIKHGIASSKSVTIEVTLPGDFVVGRPIRLKGMGRRLGPWRGDLYLRLLAR